MPSYIENRSILHLIYALILITMVLLGILAVFNWIVSVVAILVLIPLVYFLFKKYAMQRRQLEEYIANLSYRVKKVGEEALLEMPIGIMLINDDFRIEWANPFLSSIFGGESLVGKSLYEVGKPLIPMIKNEEAAGKITVHERDYKVINRFSERLLYFFDITEQVKIENLYEDEKTVIAFIYLDNYDELTQRLDDQSRSSLNSIVTSILNNWANNKGILLKSTSSERFIAILNANILQELEKEKFSILDEVREVTTKQNIPLTLSIGIATGDASLPELGSLAQSSLDLALGRGGDQVAIKHINGKVKFFGGKTNPVEKRTRVRARVISHALRELIVDSDQVFIMGHKNPDMDAIGSAIGIHKIAQINQRKDYIVMDFDGIGRGVARLMEEVMQDKELFSKFITPEQALEIVTKDSLLVLVDTHKPSMVVEGRLLKEIDHVVVIDHHRRGEEFINNPLLVYMEPYASSTAELVTELLEYQHPKRGKFSVLEATALLAGIFVDTKGFTLRTGSRTFDAASYLRGHGADTVTVQRFLKEDVEAFIQKAKIIESFYFYQDGIAIAKGNNKQVLDQVLLAQAADTLLGMDDISASFVIAYRDDGTVGISARSLGDVNVQIIMESLNGGGHLTNAATQLKDVSIEEVEKQLHQAIDEYMEGRESL